MVAVRYAEDLAEEEGFEPPVPFSTAVFKTAAIDHSATPPGTLAPTDSPAENQPFALAKCPHALAMACNLGDDCVLLPPRSVGAMAERLKAQVC